MGRGFSAKILGLSVGVSLFFIQTVVGAEKGLRDQIGHPGPGGNLLDENPQHRQRGGDEKDGKYGPV